MALSIQWLIQTEIRCSSQIWTNKSLRLVTLSQIFRIYSKLLELYKQRHPRKHQQKHRLLG